MTTARLVGIYYPMLFKPDLTELKALQELYKKNPRLYRRASISMVNQFAFRAKKIAPKEIDKGNIVRAPRFISKSIRVDKANSQRPMAVVGTISRDRFTGLKEQEFGKTAKRRRTATTRARFGDKKRKLPTRHKLRPSTEVWKPSKFKIGRGQGRTRQTQAFLQRISREPTASRKPFMISRQFKGFQPGIYRMMGRDRIIKLWTFQQMKAKRTRWMEKTVKRTYTQRHARLFFAKALKREQKRHIPNRLKR